MSIYSCLPKRKSTVKNFYEDKKRRTFSVDNELYEKLKFLSKMIYDVSINELVIIAIKDLIQSEDVKPYVKSYDEFTVDRTYLIDQKLLDQLEELKYKYSIPITRLVNIAIHNAIIGDNNIKENQGV